MSTFHLSSSRLRRSFGEALGSSFGVPSIQLGLGLGLGLGFGFHHIRDTGELNQMHHSGIDTGLYGDGCRGITGLGLGLGLRLGRGTTGAMLC